MVRLSKIYTKVGDAGQTMLGDGAFVPKTHPRVKAYGTVDEANAALGVAICALPDVVTHAHPKLHTELELIQHDLFDCGADLCTPMANDEAPGAKLRIQAQQTKRLEALIDHYNAPLKPLDSFVLPGGSLWAAQLHVARTVTRRAERCVAALLAAESAATNPETLIYLNRLSDLLFVLARVANVATGAGDHLWKPGQSRSAQSS
ncbi:MAG: cob(I)yrinic acid a,c-diamide adenosyltransferase [Phycisphaerales bacterium]|nr:cob(I)yrinic acid a,c-diamide adenosyltransferase [Phycisphaerales bacterium]